MFFTLEPNPQETPKRSPVRARAWTYRLSVATALAVFPLVFVGAGVTSKDAGLAYPDGFTSNGYLFRNPPGWTSQDATFWEHGHRLLGRAAGLLAIAAFVISWRARSSAWRITGIVLGAIILQGLMGALRVEQISTRWAMIHGIWGQACFALACCAALITSPSWARSVERLEVRAGKEVRIASWCTLVSLLIQLCLGAALRHFPSGAATVAHVLWAIVVLFLIGWFCMWVIGYGRALPSVIPMRLAQVMGCLTAIQLMLGGFSWLILLAGGPNWAGLWKWLIPTAHVAVGALILSISALLVLCLRRWTVPLPSYSQRPVLSTAVIS